MASSATNIEDLAAELVGLDDAELDAYVRDLELSARAAQARYSVALAVVEARTMFRRDGHRSMKGYLRATTNASNAEVWRHRKLMTAVDCAPVGDALAAGRIGVPQAIELGKAQSNPRVVDAVRCVIDTLVEWAEQSDFDEFVSRLGEFVMFVDQDGSWRHIESNVQGRRARVSVVDGTIDIAAFGGDPLTAEELSKIHQHQIDVEFRHDCETRRDQYGDLADQHPMPRSASQRSFDALVTLLRRGHHATLTPGSASDPLVEIVTDADTGTDVLADAGVILPGGEHVTPDDLPPRLLDQLMADPDTALTRRCRTKSGAPIHPTLLLRALLTGYVRRSIIDDRGVTIDHGRTTRLYPPAARTAATLLVQTCTHPGCTIPADRCDIDHMRPWNHHGHTDQDNATPRCGPHNRFKHNANWTVRRTPDGRIFNQRPDGSIVHPVGQRQPEIDGIVDHTRRRRTA